MVFEAAKTGFGSSKLDKNLLISRLINADLNKIRRRLSDRLSKENRTASHRKCVCFYDVFADRFHRFVKVLMRCCREQI